MRLEELGTIIDSVEDDKTASWFYAHNQHSRAIVLAIQRQPGTNTIEVTDGVKNLLPVFQAEIPPSVHMDILYDRSDTIRESYRDVEFTMVLTLGLVVMVIFLFLRNLSATIIPSLALPFSIIGTFAVMYLLNFSLDNLSMMALILSIGFVVDDAIVMLENIVRHIELGEQPLQASLRGSGEIGFTIVSMTLSLAAVFIPVLFLGGVLGRLFKEFAITICVAILISGVVSVTLTPMLCSRFLRSAHEEKRSWFYYATERFFDGMLHVYDRSLTWVLRYRPVTMAVSALVLAATLYMFVTIPKGFIPDQDTDQMQVYTEAAQGTSYYQMVDYEQKIADLVSKDPNVDSLMASVGGTTASNLGGPNYGELVVHLKPRGKRRLGVNDIIKELRPKLAGLAGMKSYLQNPPTIQIGGQVTKSLYQFSMQTPDKAELYADTARLLKQVEQVPGVEDVASDVAVQTPQVDVTIDRDKAAVMNVNANLIENALYDAYGPRWVSTIYGSVNEYKVLLELEPKYQADPRALSLLYFKNSNGKLIPLDTMAHVVTETGPQTINHYGQLPSATISFNLQPGASLGEVVKRIQELADRELPATIGTQFQGAAKAFQSSLGNLWVLLIIAIAVVYIVLGILYESYIHPITILSGLPSAGFGALMTLLSLPHRPEHLRVRGPHHADRHCGEERHHADRFRPGSRAPARPGPPRRHLRRLPDPFPPHHDDHHVGHAGRRPHRARLRRRRRGPPAARPGGSGRPAVFAARDALPHPRLLHLHGRAAGARARLEARQEANNGSARGWLTPCTTIHHILRAPRRMVGQVFNLRRIVNPPAALGRARHDRGESPTPFAARRYAGQIGNLRRLGNPPAARLPG